jgi:hypothetical protein
MPLANGCIPPRLPLMNEVLHEEDDGSHDGEEQLIKVSLQLTDTPPPLMNEVLHEEDDGPHDGEEQLIQVSLQLTAIPLPPL